MRLSVCLLTKNLRSLLMNMPKESVKKILKPTRKLKKESMTLFPPGSISLQVLHNSLYVFTDQTRYLFNCGEGTQRLAHEHKLKLAKLDHVFLTSGRWERIGGLPGLVLTVQDIGVDGVVVHGPPGVNRLFKHARRFIILKDLQITTLNTLNSEKYADHILTVKYVNIPDGTTEQLPPLQQPEGPDFYKNRTMATIKCNESGNLTKNTAVCYIIDIKPKEGTLLIDKCIEFGVKPGPLLGKLKSGIDVTLEDGRIVKAADVRGRDCGGGIVIVMDCPTKAHLPYLLKSTAFDEYKSNTFPHVVVHFTPYEILVTDDYKNFLQSFPMSTTHLLINETMLSDANEAVHRMQTKLRVIDEKLFPPLVLKPKGIIDLGVKVVVGETGLKINLRPLTNTEDPTLKITPSEYASELTTNEEFINELQKFQSRPLKSHSTNSSLLFLGTGSSIPNKTRNVSAILVKVDKSSSILFDCGEGTLQQLKRFHDYDEIMNSLKAIYISHMHADHHLGLISFLKLKNLTIIAPKQMKSWLEEYTRDFEQLKFDLIPADAFIEENNENTELCAKLNLEKIQTTLVKHCPYSFGISIVTKENTKITYSGDTLPCDNLITLGLDSDILIHEATMEDGMEGEALKKMHSTVSQAIETGIQMNAKNTILTHFSQRYSKIPFIERLPSNVILAFDNMEINCGDISRGEGMMDILGAAWKEEVHEMEGRKLKRERRAEFVAN